MHVAKITVTVMPSNRPGEFVAALGGQPLCCSHEPLLAAARELTAAGIPPGTILTMRHAGSDVDALTVRLGVAARLTVEDGRNGTPRLRRWKAPPRRGSTPPISFGDPTGAVPAQRRGP